jgi:hypothetical protein
MPVNSLVSTLPPFGAGPTVARSASFARRVVTGALAWPICAATNETALVEAAVGLVRRQLESRPQEQSNWNYALRDEAANDSRRHRGRQLFALAIAFVMKPSQRPRLLDEGRKLGYEYGMEARQGNVGLAATGRAVRFFRSQLIEAIRSEEQSGGMDADDVRIQWLIDQFLDEVLYAVLDGYEQRTEEAAIQLPATTETFKRS